MSQNKPKFRIDTNGVLKMTDGFANVISGLGSSNAKQLANHYAINHSQVDLDNAYRTSTWFGKIVDIPAEDAVREWRSWQAEKDQITEIEKTEKRLHVRAKVKQALIWQRLYGGAVIIPGVLPGRTETPFNTGRLAKGGLSYLTVLNRHEISAHGLIRDPLNPDYGTPEYYTVSTETGEYRFDASRVVRFNGRCVQSRVEGNDGWGDSIWMHLQDAIMNSDLGSAVLGALLHESKIDVVRLPSLMANMVSSDAEQILIKRFQMAAMMKSISNILLLDKEEEWDQKQIDWNGLPEVVTTLLTVMAGAADIPVTRLVGTSAKGLNATGEGDLKNYYDSVKAKQELELEPQLEKLDRLIIQSALGSDNGEVWYSWRPLYQLSEKERSEIDKRDAETAKIYQDTGLVPTDALEKSVQNRMIESGRWPGLEQGIDDFNAELEETDNFDPEQVADAAPRTLYVYRKVLNAVEIIEHFKAQGFETTLPEDDLHVTVAFSRRKIDWMKVGQPWDSRLTISEGGPRLMEEFNGKAKVLLFTSNELEYRHWKAEEAGASWDHSEYQPHITISYAENAPELKNVEPWRGEIILGPEIFEEVKEDWASNIKES